MAHIGSWYWTFALMIMKMMKLLSCSSLPSTYQANQIPIYTDSSRFAFSLNKNMTNYSSQPLFLPEESAVKRNLKLRQDLHEVRKVIFRSLSEPKTGPNTVRPKTSTSITLKLSENDLRIERESFQMENRTSVKQLQFKENLNPSQSFRYEGLSLFSNGNKLQQVHLKPSDDNRRNAQLSKQLFVNFKFSYASRHFKTVLKEDKRRTDISNKGYPPKVITNVGLNVLSRFSSNNHARYDEKKSRYKRQSGSPPLTMFDFTDTNQKKPNHSKRLGRHGGLQKKSDLKLLYTEKAGKFLRISGEGRIHTADKYHLDEFCVIRVIPVDQKHKQVVFKIQGEWTGFYLAMSSDAQLYTTTNNNDLNTDFVHIYAKNSHDALKSRHGFYMAFDAEGRPVTSRVRSQGKKRAHLLIQELEDYDSTLRKKIKSSKPVFHISVSTSTPPTTPLQLQESLRPTALNSTAASNERLIIAASEAVSSTNATVEQSVTPRKENFKQKRKRKGCKKEKNRNKKRCRKKRKKKHKKKEKKHKNRRKKIKKKESSIK